VRLHQPQSVFFHIALNFACDCNRYNALTASCRDGFINHLHQVR
jgi:hypothetical protein